MVTVLIDDRILLLAALNVVDVRPDGTLALNGAFLRDCREAYAADRSVMDTVIASHILDRARGQGISVEHDIDALTLAVLEIGSPDVEAG